MQLLSLELCHPHMSRTTKIIVNVLTIESFHKDMSSRTGQTTINFLSGKTINVSDEFETLDKAMMNISTEIYLAN